MNAEVLRAALEALESGEKAVLVTVVAVEGPAPRGPGAKMLVFPDGRTVGTVGGGILEQEAITQARELLGRGEGVELVVHNLVDRGLRCGGGRSTLFYEFLSAEARLYVFGAGHVGSLLARLAWETAAFPVVVFDERPEHAGELCPGVVVRHLPGYAEIPALPLKAYVVICTDSHERDFQVARQVLGQDPGPPYVGMLGSLRKSEEIRARLLGAGISEERLARLHCPVGLPLGGRFPGAVALSILAEILAFHHGRLRQAQHAVEQNPNS